MSLPGTPDGVLASLRHNWRAWSALGIILLLALALRLARLDATSLWYDEGWSVHLAREPLGSALQQIGSEGHTHPPGYYLLLMAWVRIWGSSVPAVRGFSVLVGVLTVWAIYGLGRNLFDRLTGLVAALAAALAPSYIVYSQETRMYALLALTFAWLLGLWYRMLYAQTTWRRRDWVALIVVEILAIYTHLFSLVALAGLGLWALWVVVRLAREGNNRPLLRWLASQAVVALAFAPWLGIALQTAATHTAERATAPTLVPFVTEVWSFLLGGHIALYGREPHFRLAAMACLVAVVGVVIWLWLSSHLVTARRPERTAIGFLILQTVLPLALIYGLMRVRPGFHPRYVLMVFVPLLALLSRGILRLLSSGWLGRAMGAVVLLLWLGSTGLAARALWSDGYYVRDNARGAVAYLLQRLPAGAAVIMDNDDWALRYYLEGTSLRDIYLEGSQPALDVEEQMRVFVRETGLEPSGRGQAALVKWNQGETDHRNLLPYLLEQQGALVETRDFAGYSAFVYDLDEEPPALAEREVDLRFGPLRFLRATVESDVPADEALTMSLTWQLERSTDSNAKVALSLVDEQGRRLAGSDREIVDSRGAGTSQWVVGQEVVGYSVLSLPAGMAPLEYMPQITVYDASNPSGFDVLDVAGAAAGKALRLDPIALHPSRGRENKQVNREALGLRALVGSPRVAEGLELQAYSLDRDQARSGEKLSIALEWHSTSADLPDYRPALRLVRDGMVLVEDEQVPAYGHYPTSWWSEGETVVEYRDLLIPLEMDSGPVELQIGVQGESSLSLGQLTVEQVIRSFTPPHPQVETRMSLGDVAELVGYDLTATDLRAGAPLSVTLYWRALGSSPVPHVVFVHLLDETGRVIAQHDGPPSGGERPTTGWLDQEYITDAHTLQWLAGGTPRPDPGPATLEVGLYEPLSGERLYTAQGDSRLILPSTIMVHQ